MRRRTLLAAGAATLAAPALAAGERVLRFSWWGGASRHEATLKAERPARRTRRI